MDAITERGRFQYDFKMEFLSAFIQWERQNRLPAIGSRHTRIHGRRVRHTRTDDLVSETAQPYTLGRNVLVSTAMKVWARNDDIGLRRRSHRCEKVMNDVLAPGEVNFGCNDDGTASLPNPSEQRSTAAFVIRIPENAHARILRCCKSRDVIGTVS